MKIEMGLPFGNQIDIWGNQKCTGKKQSPLELKCAVGVRFLFLFLRTHGGKDVGKHHTRKLGGFGKKLVGVN